MIPKVSILVPIFNVSLFIERCAISLFEQTFSNIEYVFVNDATEDDSLEKLLKIIEKYPLRKKQVKIINHTFNKGPAVARNTAIDNSIGEFISIVDSDDYIDLDMIEILVKTIIEYNADMVISDLMIEYSNHKTLFYNNLATNKIENIKNLILQEHLTTSLCGKLFSRNLITNVECRVPEYLYYMEDGCYLIRMFYFANNIVKSDNAFYHYVQYNSFSITKSKVKMHFENVIEFCRLQDVFFIKHNVYEEYKTTIELSKVKKKINLMIGTNSFELRKKFGNMFYEIEMQYISYFRIGEKIMLLLIHYKLYLIAHIFHNILVFKNRKHIQR